MATTSASQAAPSAAGPSSFVEPQSSEDQCRLQPSDEQVERVTSRIAAVRRRIAEASSGARRTHAPRLVAISKLHPPTAILAAHRHASPPQLHFGENYAQELEAKARVLPPSIQWHFVGKLQSNKAKLVAGIRNVFLVETLDSQKLATALDKARANLAQQQRPGGGGDEGDALPLLGVYIQINTSGEEAKGGLAPLEQDGNKGSDVVQLATHVMRSCPHLELRGVMTIGAAVNSMAQRDGGSGKEVSEASQQDVEQQALSMNPDFDVLSRTRCTLVKMLRSAAEEGGDWAPGVRDRYTTLLSSSSADATGGLEISMGMSNDLETAVRAGSSNVRVGTDCFGARPPSREEAMAAMDDELKAEQGSGGRQ